MWQVTASDVWVSLFVCVSLQIVCQVLSIVCTYFHLYRMGVFGVDLISPHICSDFPCSLVTQRCTHTSFTRNIEHTNTNPNLVAVESINFGPAHPAAHGVFRLVLLVNSEVVISATHSQGLLFRATENLLEYRFLNLVSGYFARLDYVAFVSQEIGFSADKLANKSQTIALVLTNQILNHLLNVSCTIADAGALGAILWAFETREVLQEQIENVSGARLHINCAFVSLHQTTFRFSDILIDQTVCLL